MQYMYAAASCICISVCVCDDNRKSGYLEGHVGDVNQLVVGEGQQVEEAQLCEGSRLDLFHTVMVQMQLLQGGEAVKGLLHQSGQR